MSEGAHIKELSESLGEPGWMRDKRAEAWRLYQEMPRPNGGEEAWRRTDVGLFEVGDEELCCHPGDNLSESDMKRILTQSHGDGHLQYAAELVQVGGAARRVGNRTGSLNGGVVFTDLGSATRDHPSLVQEYFMTGGLQPEISRFDALHGALWTGGAFLYVPEGVEVALPFHTLFYLEAEKKVRFPHLLVILERGSRATLFTQWLSGGFRGPARSYPTVEVFVGEGASFNFLSIQDYGSGVRNLSTKRLRAGRDSRILWVEGLFGGKLSKEDIEIELEGPGAELDLVGAFLTRGDQHLDMSPLIHHTAPHTKGDVLINGTLEGNSRAIFHGMVRIEKEALFADAHLTNHNLLLSQGARADTIPKLEIECNEVKASHGVTAGELDGELVYYAMSRGLDEKAAKKVIVDGFYENILRRIPNEGLRKVLEDVIRRKTGT